MQNIIEYYDELYPVLDGQRAFFDGLIKSYPQPAKLLRVGCRTGLFEHQIAREGSDVTGIDSSQEMIRSANLRRRNQLMCVRFFEMSYMDMARFLGKGFYNIISCMEDRIIFIKDTTLLKKFFYDCHQLMAPQGVLVLELTNYAKYNPSPLCQLPVKESIRAKLFSELVKDPEGNVKIDQNLETGNGKLIPVLEHHSVRLLMPEELEGFAKEAGFSKVEMFSDYEKHPFTKESDRLLAVMHN